MDKGMAQKKISRIQSRQPIVGVLIAVFSANGVLSHEREQPFPIYELANEDLERINISDGSVQDWVDAIGNPSLTIRDFVIDRRGEDTINCDPADLDFRIWLGWHQANNRIYVAIETTDDIYVNSYNGITAFPFMGYFDSISFMVDGDHSGGEFHFFRTDFVRPDDWKQFHQVTAQTYSAIARVPDNRYVNLFRLDEWFSRPPYVDGYGNVHCDETHTNSVIEFYVTPFDKLVWNNPEQSVISKLFLGKVIGFAVNVYDYDAAPQQLHAAYVLPEGRSIFTADLFVDGVLVGRNGEIPRNIAVDHDIWAWIKKMFDE